MLFYGLLFIILKFGSIFGDGEHRRVIRQNGAGTCTTEDNTFGTCINIKNCPSLLNLLNTRSREPTVAAYLRKSRCGKENNNVKVCCPSTGGVVIPPITATQPVPITTTQPIPVTRTTQRIQPVAPTNGEVPRRLDENSNTDYSKCGKSDKKATRIIGGQPALLGDWPWMAALGYRTYRNPGPIFRCGGSLISNRWVVTAAHCVSSLGSYTLSVIRLGDLNLNSTVEDKATPIDVPVDEIIPHPKYSTYPITSDIALIRLRNPVKFTKLIRPICILSQDEHRSDGFYHGKMPFAVGWGSTEHNGPTTNVLLEAQVPVVDTEQCAQNYLNQKQSEIDQRVICAGSAGKDACGGDSGGPMIVPIGNTYNLAGVVSYGIGCGDEKYPGVYTRVAYFADWIRQTAGL